MLVLTRKSEQKIIIGNKQQITITILSIDGNQVSLGIEADREIPIYREEIFNEIKEANTLGVVTKDDVNVRQIAENLQIKKHRRSAKPIKNDP
ncbi:MAG: putative carbon storage regulatory protein [Chlamydiales bacterium]|jgi:carbon storage regulator|nr:putative carbon storage regulatory protein [Chlamydiales bacterium]